MKVPTKKIFLFLLCLPFWAAGQSVLEQTCNLQVSQVPIEKALKQLSTQCGLDLVYSNRFFKKEKPVSLEAKDWKVSRILSGLLAEADVSYRELDGQIIFFIEEKKPKEPVTLSGFVEDAETGERLIAAAVYCPQLGHGTITNEFGHFSFNLPPEGTQEIIISYLGYQEQSQQVELSANQTFSFSLEPALTLTEIVVTPKASKGTLLPSPNLGINLNYDAFPASPDLGGESDLLRIMQLLPGVQSGADGFGGMNIRGAGSENNLVLLDGVPVYNPSHLLGMLSIFNTSAVKNSRLIKSGIPARYGGRLSSIIDVRTREGSTKKWGVEAGADFISGKAALQVPFDKGKGSILIAGRWAFNDFLLSESIQRVAFFNGEEPLNGYKFQDLNWKVSYRFSERNKWFLSFYRGSDDFSGIYVFDEEIGQVDGTPIFIEDKITNNFSWGNHIISLRWNHVFSPKGFANTTLTYTRYDFVNSYFRTISAIDEELEDQIDFGTYEAYGSDIFDVSLRTDFELARNENHYLRYGIGAIFHSFRPDNVILEGDDFDGVDLDELDINNVGDQSSAVWQGGLEMDAYVEDEFKVGNNWHFNLGLRLSAFASDAAFYTIEPRLSSQYHLNEKWKLTAALDRTSQYLHRLNYNEINLPSDIWIPADDELDPQRSWQGTLGASYEIKPGLDFSMEAFAKKMTDIKSFAYYFFDNLDQEVEIIPNNDGTAHGLELFLRKTGKKTGGWMSYTWSKATRELKDFAPGAKYTFRYDRRHDFKMFLYHRLGERIQLGMNFVYGSPQPILQVVNTDELLEPTAITDFPPYPLRPLRRLPAYHRLDFSIAYTVKKKKWEHNLKLSTYNVYNQENIGFYLNADVEEEPIRILPRVLGLHYGVKF